MIKEEGPTYALLRGRTAGGLLRPCRGESTKFMGHTDHWVRSPQKGAAVNSPLRVLFEA